MLAQIIVKMLDILLMVHNMQSISKILLSVTPLCLSSNSQVLSPYVKFVL